MTNYERIKSMSIEELAETKLMCPYDTDAGLIKEDCHTLNCTDCLIDWLQKEEVEQ